MIKWFEATPPPAEPFALYDHVYVGTPARFWQLLKDDIAVGPGRARDYYGAVRKDLRRLARLFGGPCGRGGTR